jgi:ubiquitin C-terminal hydrolase
MKLALKQLDILKFPRYLIIQINRFKNGPSGTKQKNS